ncbi:hypothetical protein RJ639_036494 [Escallonia herrerae]|uniref:Alkane hydroxylase MAH1-like n=1 Tax=Escallonia herrerae TaxID=1293975 RepID=A0AA89B997_9ASTE|nr:hypothetical protein RJ639_036494 [Escallonia herrerae]
MAILEYPQIFLLPLFSFLFLCLWRRSHIRPQRTSLIPINWPLIGMLPRVLREANRIHEFATEVLRESGGTFIIKGPWFSNVEMVVTGDPANVHHILSKNFSNYPKGPEFNKIFDILGDGIFNADKVLWETQRRTTMSLVNHSKFQKFSERTSWNKVKRGLIPILQHATEKGLEVDLQGLFERLTYDSVCILVLGHDPASLSIDLPHIPSEKAFGEAEEAVLYRHVLPESIWKLQKWLDIGKEKKLTKAWKAFDHFLAHCIAMKREELIKRKAQSAQNDHQEEEDLEDADLLTPFLEAYKGMSGESGNCDKFLRDALLSLVFAGRDTTSAALTWFFWLLSTNPLLETKIRKEIKANMTINPDNDKYWRLFDIDVLNKLVYLHGALCESLRLFPPVPLQHKAPLEPDILPSGHRISKNMKTVISFYSMGRMESIWGKDCLEFKPERWISDQGGIKHVPSYKFVAFNAGPRSCLGKDMSFTQMKIVAAAIVHHYHVEVVQGHPISLSNSVVLHMKHGLKVRVTKT